MKLLSRGLVAILILLSISTYALAENKAIKGTEQLSQLMQAISQNDYDAFIARGNSQFKRSLTKQAFQSVVNQLGKHIEGGYKATYLAELNQQGNRILVWKISYEKNSDEMTAKLVMDDEKVAGFWMQ